MPELNEKLLKLVDVAELLGVKSITVKRWADKKGLPAYKIGSMLYFRESQVQEWLEGCKVEGSNSNSG